MQVLVLAPWVFNLWLVHLIIHASAQTIDADPQTSLTLLPSLVASNFSQDGLNSPGSTPDLVPSLTSPNNFINFCATVQDSWPLTNGQQLPNGSCNPAPMGVLAPRSSMPSAKFIFPQNLQRIPANQTFTIQLAVRNLATGWATNSAANYMAAPQQLDAAGRIQGHSHVVIDRLDSDALGSTVPTDPAAMVFFKALNDKDVGGVLTTNVVGGLPPGAYRLASINTAANHQPALVSVAQHGALDDMVYFVVGEVELANTNGGYRLMSTSPMMVFVLLVSIVCALIHSI